MNRFINRDLTDLMVKFRIDTSVNKVDSLAKLRAARSMKHTGFRK